jgi:hypothetical protein
MIRPAHQQGKDDQFVHAAFLSVHHCFKQFDDRSIRVIISNDQDHVKGFSDGMKIASLRQAAGRKCAKSDSKSVFCHVKRWYPVVCCAA